MFNQDYKLISHSGVRQQLSQITYFENVMQQETKICVLHKDAAQKPPKTLFSRLSVIGIVDSKRLYVDIDEKIILV